MLVWIRFMFIAVPSVQLELGLLCLGVFPEVLWSVLSSCLLSIPSAGRQPGGPGSAALL